MSALRDATTAAIFARAHKPVRLAILSDQDWFRKNPQQFYRVRDLRRVGRGHMMAIVMRAFSDDPFEFFTTGAVPRSKDQIEYVLLRSFPEPVGPIQ
jgi:hypothetical protein